MAWNAGFGNKNSDYDDYCNPSQYNLPPRGKHESHVAQDIHARRTPFDVCFGFLCFFFGHGLIGNRSKGKKKKKKQTQPSSACNTSRVRYFALVKCCHSQRKNKKTKQTFWIVRSDRRFAPVFCLLFCNLNWPGFPFFGISLEASQKRKKIRSCPATRSKHQV
ncbi:hypothetical protein I7I53_09080 [Histoplasma capsulatum var. duboisii H88]|uniref:Uncharacterized protein n=1 Tax=Ajellomyces capsulatus (strain H88) TaxID=544711 RepID=A0A8A1L8W9_AJEC8|nr:hypothetical protein I7I53_09080 [Histoplasma capsulatum var. duboisii H88]